MADNTNGEKQCRICLDGEDPLLGRLIRPCLCSGSIAYVHVECLQLWRRESQSAWYRCPQCHYKYMTVRANFIGMAQNQIIIVTLSVFVFSCLAYVASFLVTLFLDDLDPDDTLHDGGFLFFGWGWVNPVDVAKNLIKTVLRALQDEDIIAVEDIFNLGSKSAPSRFIEAPQKLGAIANFLRRILIGIPVLGATSIIQILWSTGFLRPFDLATRHRGRNRRDSRDFASVVILIAMIFGILRALWGIYKLTERYVQKLLHRAEDFIIEV